MSEYEIRNYIRNIDIHASRIIKSLLARVHSEIKWLRNSFAIFFKRTVYQIAWESFIFVIQWKKKEIWNSRSKSILRQMYLYTYLHEIEGAEFICDSHGQTFLSILYICTGRGVPSVAATCTTGSVMNAGPIFLYFHNNRSWRRGEAPPSPPPPPTVSHRKY